MLAAPGDGGAGEPAADGAVVIADGDRYGVLDVDARGVEGVPLGVDTDGLHAGDGAEVVDVIDQVHEQVAAAGLGSAHPPVIFRATGIAAVPVAFRLGGDAGHLQCHQSAD